jgi:RNA polymerase sigma-70 factor, ECF subfamily
MTIRARQLCRGSMDPDDLVQEAALRACQRREQLRDPACARAWLLAIVYRIFVDAVRRQRVRNEVFLAVEPPDLPPDEPAVPVAWHHVTQDGVRAAIAHLPDELRATYLLFALEGRSYADIATRLDIPRATVGTRIHRARRHLRTLLASPGAAPQ